MLKPLLDEVDEVVTKLLAGPEGRTDPHRLCRRLRRLGPVLPTRHGVAFTTTYAESRFALRDPRFGRGDVGDRVRRDPRLLGTRLLQWEQTVLPFVDPPQHTRLRRLIGSALSARYMEAQRHQVRAFVHQVLRRAREAGRFDAVADLAAPLPFWTTAEMFNIPNADRGRLQAWTARRAESLQRVTTATPLEPVEEALRDSEAYLIDLTQTRRRRPGDDLLSRLITSGSGGDRLGDEEIAANVNQLFSAGLDTVKYLIGNALLALLRHPRELAALRQKPGLARNAVEETLRYEPGMVLAPARVLSEDLEFAGQHLRSGDRVCPILLSANRDPARYGTPDRFWIERPDIAPLSFGGGLHHCLGAPLARVQTEEVLRAFATLLTRAELVPSGLLFSDDIGRRGPDRLLVRCA